MSEKLTVNSIAIRRGYGADQAYECTVALRAPGGDMNIKIPEDRVNQIVTLVADLVVESTRSALEGMTRDAMAVNLIEQDLK
jgi:hypothetical protein